MPAPVAAPLAAPIAGAAVKGAAQGIGAALRYGPGLLQLADAFRRPGGLGGTVADVPRRQKLAELIADAVAGARLGVALPPPPGFPGPSPLGPLGPLQPWDGAARALVAALGQLAQRWGGHAGKAPGSGELEWRSRQVREGNYEQVGNIVVRGDYYVESGSSSCVTGGVAFRDSSTNTFQASYGPANGIRFNPVPLDFRSGCGDASSVRPTGQGLVEFLLDGETVREQWVGVAGFIAGGDGTSSFFISEAFAESVTINGVFVSPDGDPAESNGIPSVEVPDPESLVGFPWPLGLFSDLPPGPLVPPLADALPADPASTDNPEALTAPAPVVPPLPAYVPRPLPGPVLPEFEPEPEAEPSRGPGTDRPARPVIPGDRPGPTVPAPVRPFPDVPAEPGVFPDNPPGPGETPNTPPAPGVTPNTPPGPVIDPGVFPQPGPPATPTGPDGNPAVPDTDTTTDTPTDQHTPVAGDDPVTGNGPAPTLQAMAREMGRQEQKLGRLLERVGNPNRPTGPGVDPPSIPDLLGLLRQVLELLGSIDGAGAYEISSPCNVDPATGEPVPPLRAEWGGSIGLERNILKRVDALAELVQHHKDLPQPICRGPRPTGEHVTVNFEQVPDDLEAPT
jgi:hypothetical protein